MAVQLGTVDGLVNITEKSIRCFIRSIDQFSNEGKDFALSNHISIGAAFQRYTMPVYKETDSEFKKENILVPVLTGSGKEQSPAMLTYCKKMGLVSCTDDGSVFELTPIARALLHEEITLQEYAFILLSKQTCFKDKIAVDNLMVLVASIFASSPTISDSIIRHISKEHFGDDDIVKTRIDIILNALALTGLTQKITNEIYVPAELGASKIFADILEHRTCVRLGLHDEDKLYANNIGSLSGGVFDYLSAQNADIYLHFFPNLSKYMTTTSSNSFVAGQPLQQIFYGAPGTGKSFTIDKDTKGHDVIRTTFHPDSDYATFVGAYKPIEVEYEKTQTIWDFTSKSAIQIPVLDPSGKPVAKEKKIEYQFVQQAFTQAYVKAWKKYKNMVVTCRPAAIPASSATSPYSYPSSFASLGVNDFDCREDVELNDNEKILLNDIDNFPFTLGQYAKVGDLHKSVRVIIAQFPTQEQKKKRRTLVLKREDVEKAKAYAESLLNQMINPNLWVPILGYYKKMLGEMDQKKVSTITIEQDTKLLGLCDTSDKSNIIVYLFKGNIGNNEVLLASTYIHEMIHAYFVSQLNLPEIEEAITECTTLCFLECMQKAGFKKSFVSGYLYEVQSKMTILPEYGYGAYLYENRSLDWMKLFKEAIPTIDKSSPLVRDYCNKFSGVYPLGEEETVMQMLYGILVKTEETIDRDNAQFLIIEEINRGNCAQIFGDLFQLLDRADNGFSSYPIVADSDMRRELAKELADIELPSYIDSLIKDNSGTPIRFSWSENGVEYKDQSLSDAIRHGYILLLPNNLYIWATMNTSDQSLFPIDSAFKRRWDWVYVPIKYGKSEWKIDIDGVKYAWVDFQKEINKRIFEATESEDKQLGDYFVKANATDIISAKLLLNKVIFYLWNDVCKDGDGDIFKINTDLDYAKELDHSKDEDITFSQFFQGTDLKLQQWMRYLDIKPIEGGDEEQEEEKHQQEEGVKPADVKDTTYSKPIYQALVESMLSKVDNKDKDVSIFQNGFDWAFTNMPGSYTRMSLSLDAPARNKKATVKLWIPAPSGYKDSAACFNYLKEHNGEALVRNVAEKYNCSFEELGIHSAKPNPVVGWKIIVPITFSEDNVDAESGLLMQIMSEMRSAFDPIITDFQKK